MSGASPDRIAEVRARVAATLRKFSAETERKRENGVCVWPECTEPASRVPRYELFFGEDHCLEHARQAEIECLEDEQQDDRSSE